MDKTIDLLNDAHDMLHRLLCVFVPDCDGASKQTYELMQRIREHLGDEFDGRGGSQHCSHAYDHRNLCDERPIPFGTRPQFEAAHRREAAQRGKSHQSFRAGGRGSK